jgi:hypothetical protein
MTPPVLAAALAMLASGGALALVMARTRVAAALGFSAAGVFAGLTSAALGAATIGIALALSAICLAALVLAGGALAGEAVERRGPVSRIALAAAIAAIAALAFASPLAPPLSTSMAAPQPAFALARGGDLFLALAALVGVAGAVAAILGFGERGVLGVERGRADGVGE